jgi:hypothetical protein
MKRLAVLLLSASLAGSCLASDPSPAPLAQPKNPPKRPSGFGALIGGVVGAAPAKPVPILSDDFLRSVITSAMRPDVTLADRTVGDYLRVRRRIRGLEDALRQLEAEMKFDARAQVGR